MGVDYTSGAFFGTFAIPGSKAEAALKALQDEETGDFLFEMVPGIHVGRHGNSWSGDFCYAIEKDGGESFTTRSGGHSGPLVYQEADEASVKRAIASLGCDESDFEPIGFYLYLDVW